MTSIRPSDAAPPVLLVRAGLSAPPGGWIVSDWPAGQTSRLAWDPANVRPAPDGLIELVLGPAPAGRPRPWCGGEVQSCATARTGTWAWLAQAPALTAGAVFGLFAYRADHAADPWLEFDIEFVGPDTRRARLNIHMQGSSGEPVTLEQARGEPVLVELGFDAARGLHLYEIEVTGRQAVFRVDGRVVGRFGRRDMPGGLWTTGALRGFANLWCVDPALEPWAGRWSPPPGPLVARLRPLGLRPNGTGLTGWLRQVRAPDR